MAADSGRERCVVQRWEMRLQTHQCMLTRFCVVSQSDIESVTIGAARWRDWFVVDVFGSVRLEDEFQ